MDEKAIFDLFGKVVARRATVQEVDTLIAYLQRERKAIAPHCACWLADDTPSDLHTPPCPLAR